MNIHYELVQIEKAIDSLNGSGFQQQVRTAMAAFGPDEARVRLEAILSNEQASETALTEARRLREWLREKCGV